jgi:hypothetical protein
MDFFDAVKALGEGKKIRHDKSRFEKSYIKYDTIDKKVYAYTEDGTKVEWRQIMDTSVEYELYTEPRTTLTIADTVHHLLKGGQIIMDTKKGSGEPIEYTMVLVNNLTKSLVQLPHFLLNHDQYLEHNNLKLGDPKRISDIHPSITSILTSLYILLPSKLKVIVNSSPKHDLLISWTEAYKYARNNYDSHLCITSIINPDSYIQLRSLNRGPEMMVMKSDMSGNLLSVELVKDFIRKINVESLEWKFIPDPRNKQ